LNGAYSAACSIGAGGREARGNTAPLQR